MRFYLKFFALRLFQINESMLAGKQASGQVVGRYVKKPDPSPEKKSVSLFCLILDILRVWLYLRVRIY